MSPSGAAPAPLPANGAPAPAPPPPSSPEREELENLLTQGPLTEGYRPTLPLWALWTQDLIPQYYLLRDLELMLIHPIVLSVLNFYKGGISMVEFEVVCDQPEVLDFAMEHCKRYWARGVPMIQGGYEYGWIGVENLFSIEQDRMQWNGVIQFSPRDVYLLTQDSRPVGVRVKNVKGKQPVDLWMASRDVPAKGLWYAHNPRYHSYYGQSQLMGAWRPWRRLAWRDGAETVIDTAIYRFGYHGPIVRYPEEDLQTSQLNVPGTTLDSQGRPRRFARDMARMIGEWAKTGATVGLPSTCYPPEMGGKPKWDLDWPDHVINADPLVNYAKYLSDQISYGIGVPPELMAASETGSGYSGRAIPMDAFIMGQQRIADRLLYLFVEQVLRPLVRWNWGDVAFEVKVKPLLETKRKAMSGESGEQPQEAVQPPEELKQPTPGGQRDQGTAPLPPTMQHGPMPAPGMGAPRAQPAGGGFSLEEQRADRVRAIAAAILAAGSAA